MSTGSSGIGATGGDTLVRRALDVGCKDVGSNLATIFI